MSICILPKCSFFKFPTHSVFNGLKCSVNTPKISLLCFSIALVFEIKSSQIFLKDVEQFSRNSFSSNHTTDYVIIAMVQNSRGDECPTLLFLVVLGYLPLQLQ